MLLELEATQHRHHAHHLLGEVRRDAGDALQDDRPLALEARIVEVEVQATALQRLRELTRRIGGEKDERHPARLHRPELGDRDLIVREHLEEQCLGLELDAVDLVDQQHHRIGRADRLQHGAGEEELLREDVALDRRPLRRLVAGRLALDLDAEQLLAVVPLVEHLRLVEALVTLEADEAELERQGDGLRELGLAGAGGALDEDRLVESRGEIDDRRDLLVGEVADLREQRQRLGGRGEARTLRAHARTWPFPSITYFTEVRAARPIGPRAWSF